jgi:hypothetical protein
MVLSRSNVTFRGPAQAARIELHAKLRVLEAPAVDVVVRERVLAAAAEQEGPRVVEEGVA